MPPAPQSGPPTRRKTFGLAGAGLLVGAVAGWVMGLIKPPREDKSAPAETRKQSRA